MLLFILFFSITCAVDSTNLVRGRIVGVTPTGRIVDRFTISEEELRNVESGNAPSPVINSVKERKRKWDQDLSVHLKARKDAVLLDGTAGETARVEREKAAKLYRRLTEAKGGSSAFDSLITRGETNVKGGGNSVVAQNVRFVLDDVIDEQMCRDIINVATPLIGKGPNLYTYFDNVFKGVPFLAIVEHYGQQNLLEMVTPLISAREIVRATVQRYFNLTSLFVDASHFTRRNMRPSDATSTEESVEGLDHGVHCDNCQNKPDGGCYYEPYHCCFWRDFSAILFLNDADDGHFRGSELFFDDTPGSEEGKVVVPPRCGRLVGFDAGAANRHGVTETIGNGYRYTLASWLTVSPFQQELSRVSEFSAKWKAKWSAHIERTAFEANLVTHDEL